MQKWKLIINIITDVWFMIRRIRFIKHMFLECQYTTVVSVINATHKNLWFIIWFNAWVLYITLGIFQSNSIGQWQVKYVFFCIFTGSCRFSFQILAFFYLVEVSLSHCCCFRFGYAFEKICFFLLFEFLEICRSAFYLLAKRNKTITINSTYACTNTGDV